MSAFEIDRARYCDSMTNLDGPHDPGMTCDDWQAKYDRRVLLRTLDEERASAVAVREALANVVQMMDWTAEHQPLQAAGGEVQRRDDANAADDMCPNCVTPWKCNGPHIPLDALRKAGRPSLDADVVRWRYWEAKGALLAKRRTPTVEAIAEELDRSPRTVRDWRKRFGLR